MSRERFRQLYHTPVQLWQEEALGELTGNELAALCQLLGVPHSGGRERLRERVWRARHLRLVLAPYELGQTREAELAAVQALAATYTAGELLALCRAADVYIGSTKYGRAAALLQWRQGCRRRGQEALAAAVAANADRPKQRRLRLE